MKRTTLGKRLALTAILSALSFSTPKAEEILHYGVSVDSEGNAYGCVACHDGLLATPIKLSTKTGNYLCTHPVNRDYPPATKADDYLPVEELTKAGIKLLKGQVSCISCHNLKNPEKPHLAVPLDKSNLCFNCHKI